MNTELQSCQHIINFDLRGNPGYSSTIHKTIVQSLLRNVKNLRAEKGLFKEAVQKKWVNPNLLADLQEEKIVPQRKTLRVLKMLGHYK